MEIERRKDYFKLEERLNSIETFQKDILNADRLLRQAILDIEALKIKIFCHVDTSLIHRDYIKKQFEDILSGQQIIEDKLDELPCDIRSGWYQSMTKQMGFMWLAVGGILTTLFILILHFVWKHAP